MPSAAWKPFAAPITPAAVRRGVMLASRHRLTLPQAADRAVHVLDEIGAGNRSLRQAQARDNEQTLEATHTKRTINDSWRLIGRLVETIQADECANYRQNARYAFVQT